MAALVQRFVGKVTRKKTVDDEFRETSLRRCLNTFDITMLGIGHMIGAGIYVLTGTVVRKKAGPSTVLSYLFAGIAAMLSALCYAEFGARVPKAGSAYSYTYITIGEIWGFIIGWNIVLEHLIGVSAVARAWSGAVDSIFNGAIRNGTISSIGYLAKDSTWFSEYPDFLAAAITIVVFVIVATGAKFSIHFNSAFTVMNGVVILFIICAGLYFADGRNWTDPGRGGFFPFGFGGTVAGAASCFFAFIGFEGIAVSGEEARNPEKSIPIATVVSLGVVTVVYMLVTVSLTLMIPYYQTEPTAAFPMAFATCGVIWAKYVVAVGTLFGITTSLLGGAFSLPRAVYAMADDGLLFRFIAYVHPRTQTPVWAIAIFGLLSALGSFLFEIETLVEFMSIGTLFAYTIVAASIIILRYLPVEKCQFQLKPEEEPAARPETEEMSEKCSIMKRSKSHDSFGKLRDHLKDLPILKHFEPGSCVTLAVVLMGTMIVCFNVTVIYGLDFLKDASWWAIILVIIFIGGIVFFYLVIVAHEQNDAFMTFQIPLVPLLPTLCIICNVALMFSLTYLTWIRLGIWMAAGLLVYFVYGMHHSRENRTAPGYGPMVEYTGDASLEGPLAGMDEDVQEQQPVRRDEGLPYESY
ncbi:cationic amino acid transporter 4-like [Gigantopelta aegis]|uniref:cationic amino acid transporter 4-like n=1 Tax=Gigantopelta aegis TaxID=1735272 RepID=UPI001B88E38B|nr:cationic amino acid transporter 4-like [Gigantopelta aegis]